MMRAAISSRPLLKGLRTGNLFSKRAETVQNAPATGRGFARGAGETVGRRGATVTEMPLRRGAAFVEDFSDRAGVEQDSVPMERRAAVRVSFTGGLVPETLWGRLAAGGGLLVLAGAIVAGVWAVRSFLLHDPHFVLESSSGVEIAGNGHVSRAQLLSVFGGDVERNIFEIPLEGRRAELESLPWVQHATVMRLLPDRVRVGIVERTPVAFVREGRRIGLVDASGVLLDFGTDGGGSDGGAGGAENTGKYSFPVVTGIAQTDPLSTRAARMRIYAGFLGALDATGEGISRKLSEVDLSDPEDVRALAPDAGSGTEVLVHFGDGRYLERYHRFEEHLAEWRGQYPHLASVDMRYEQQVVLEMLPGAVGQTAAKGMAEGVAKEGVAAVPTFQRPGAGHWPGKMPMKVGPTLSRSRTREVGHPAPGRAVASTAAAAPVHHLKTAFGVGAVKDGGKAAAAGKLDPYRTGGGRTGGSNTAADSAAVGR